MNARERQREAERGSEIEKEFTVRERITTRVPECMRFVA